MGTVKDYLRLVRRDMMPADMYHLVVLVMVPYANVVRLEQQ